MQVTRVSAGYYQKSFGAKLSKRVEESIQIGQERYKEDPVALEYYNKRVDEAKTIRPEIDVIVRNEPGGLFNFAGDDLVFLQKGTRLLCKPQLDLPLFSSDLNVADIACLDGITALCECLKNS